LLVLKPLDAEEWERVSALGSIASARRLEVVEGSSREAAVISRTVFWEFSVCYSRKIKNITVRCWVLNPSPYLLCLFLYLMYGSLSQKQIFYLYTK
jgi:hypothetical protein